MNLTTEALTKLYATEQERGPVNGQWICGRDILTDLKMHFGGKQEFPDLVLRPSQPHLPVHNKFQFCGMPLVVDALMPPNMIMLRDAITGDILATITGAS